MRTTRRISAGDADALLGLQHAHQTAVLGRTDSTADDVRDQLADPHLDPVSFVVPGQGDALDAAVLLFTTAAGHVDLDITVSPAATGLLPELVASAVELAVAGSPGGVRVDHGCYRSDTALADALRGHAFAPATTFHRMRRELDRPVEPDIPAGVRVEQADTQDEDVLRRAYDLHMETFAGHFGFVAHPWDEWVSAHRTKTGLGPLWFAGLDGRDVGFLLETDQFVEDEDSGYVWRLGVRREARGRGVARGLLLASFADMQRRGRRAAVLHVDTANATGATALYESVGMRPVLVIDVWRWAGSAPNGD